MKDNRFLLRRLGWDGLVFSLCGVAAIVISVLDFAQLLKLSTEDGLKVVILAVGLMMFAVSVQTSHRESEIETLRNAVGVTSVQLIRAGVDFQMDVAKCIHQAKDFVLDTTLNAEGAMIMHPADDPSRYYYALFERLRKGGIKYRRVETITDKERLEYVISRLIIFGGMDYLVRYFDRPAKPVPVLNLMSIDNNVFYLGGFYISDPPTDALYVAAISGPEMRKLFEAYWENLWYSASPLNPRGHTDWRELKSIAGRVGMSEAEFDNLVTKWEAEVARRKRRVP